MYKHKNAILHCMGAKFEITSVYFWALERNIQLELVSLSCDGHGKL